jgi:murein DD-endopeptidase MepM/ murein hydrolase activator NlpD
MILKLITVLLLISNVPCFAQHNTAEGQVQTDTARIDIVKRDDLMPGEAVIVEVETSEDVSSVSGVCFDKEIKFWQERKQLFRGLVGFDRNVSPGSYSLHLKLWMRGGSKRDLVKEIEVLARDFGVVKLRIRSRPGGLTKEEIARIRAERALIDSVLSKVSSERLWHSSFAPPLDRLTVTGDFGTARIINGRERNPHGGLDLRASAGTPVLASNDGIVAFSGDHFYSGKSVYIDHGLGVFSMYFHLSTIMVQYGDLVGKGQVIGKIGSTGRSTGPHLHWAFTVNRARIDPISIISLPVE